VVGSGWRKPSIASVRLAPNPEQLYLQAELRELLRTGLSKLRPILRVVFVLRDIEELSISETAAILNVSSDVVKVRLHRARLELREWLSRYFQRDRLASHDVLHARSSAWKQESGPDHPFRHDRQNAVFKLKAECLTWPPGPIDEKMQAENRPANGKALRPRFATVLVLCEP